MPLKFLGYGSYKIIENDTLRQIIYGFILVGHCKYSCMALSCTVLEIFDVDKYCDLEIWIRGHLPCEFMHDLYIAEIYRPANLFYD